ncbi:MAG: FKBP-type peptidyl-prolyl cis-trans isomerase [Candidatus Competibacteraceae bacterium]|jgi:FKBP-type peptidyl-prolyl cis-trans isomerase|nr:FKBP-type peptidyl-prolyl cis-trans isomerase [Candidatus Competibacteraceae bacterium]
MKLKAKLLTLTAASLLATGLCSTVLAQELDTEQKKLSYVIGMEIGSSLKSGGADVDFAILSRAIEDMLTGKEPLITAEEAQTIKQAYFQKVQEQRASEAKVAGEKNRAEGDAFLAKNKDAEGVVTTDSGLQYQVIKEGEGAKPKATDQVTVNYKGTLIDGTEFDSSYKRGQPATFPVTGVIPGWTEALQLMSVGSTYRLFIPSELAYGERGAGGAIGPNAVLIFEVELMDIAQSEPQTGPAESEAKPE